MWILITGTDADTDIHTDEKKGGWNEKEKETKEKETKEKKRGEKDICIIMTCTSRHGYEYTDTYM